jgi:hypothetical protein
MSEKLGPSSALGRRCRLDAIAFEARLAAANEGEARETARSAAPRTTSAREYPWQADAVSGERKMGVLSGRFHRFHDETATDE